MRHTRHEKQALSKQWTIRQPPAVSSPEITAVYKVTRDALQSSQVLGIQRRAGNRAVSKHLEQKSVQRDGPGIAPPKRPGIDNNKDSPKKSCPMPGQMTFAQVYVAIQQFDHQCVLDDNFARFDKSELRTLDSLIDRTIDKAHEIAVLQKKDSNYSPPGLPDLVYKNAIIELRKIQESQIRPRKPYAAVSALLALHDMMKKDVGSNPTSHALWRISTNKVRELLWREEFGSVGRIIGYDEAFSDAEILKYGYVDRTRRDTIHSNDPGAWGHIAAPGLAADRRIPTSLVVDAIRAKNNLVPLNLAKALLNYAESDTVPELLGRLSETLDTIDQTIKNSLQLIYNAQVSGFAPWREESVTTHEAAFFKWLTSEGMKSGSVYAEYRVFAAGEEKWYD